MSGGTSNQSAMRSTGSGAEASGGDGRFEGALGDEEAPGPLGGVGLAEDRADVGGDGEAPLGLRVAGADVDPGAVAVDLAAVGRLGGGAHFQ